MDNLSQVFRSVNFFRQASIAKLLTLILFCTGLQVQAQQISNYVENQIIVKIKEGIQAVDIVAMQENLNATVVKKFSLIGAEVWDISGLTVEEAISLYQADPHIEYIEPNYNIYAITAVPNDPGFNELWGLNNTGQTGGTADADIDAPEAWNIQTGTDVVVGVIDTGVDWSHEDLADNIWVNPGEIPSNGVDDDGNGYIDDVRGWDFINNDSNPMDDNGHGTHVSGTIGAVGDNGIGVVGVCWSVQIMPLKFLGSSGSGSSADAISAIEYATMMGANLTSNSWGGGGFSQALYDAIAASQSAGMLFIAAAGNDGTDNDFGSHYPSSYDLDNIIAVAATTDEDLKSSFSNYGLESVDLGAPGSNIYSTLPGNSYGSLSGTSMATPHVSGAAALIWSQFPNLTNFGVKDRILNSVDPISALAGRTVSGGRLNAFNSLAQPDSISPGAVTNLSISGSSSNSITLNWTASGDDGFSGMAASYDIRYSLSPIDEGNFDSATEVSGEPKPQEAGSTEMFTVTGLGFNTTYYFALKVLDEWGNTSGVSNSPSGTTLGAPDLTVAPTSLNETLPTGETATQTLTISNVGDGTLSFDLSIEGTSAAAASVAVHSPGDAGVRDPEWIYQILQTNEQVAAKANPAIGEAKSDQLSKTAPMMNAAEIWRKIQQSASSESGPIYAVVLDGLGTYSASNRLWDELNANWSLYGNEEILIDYATFHTVEITYAALAASAADVVIISNNWNPTQSYGAFSEAEAMAIAQYVNEGAGLFVSAGTFNNGEFPELQPHVDFLAPLVGLSATETYFWNGNTYGSLNFTNPDHPVLRSISEPFASGWQNKTSTPSGGSWTPASIPGGTLVGVSDNQQTVIIVNGNRIYHAGLPEHVSGSQSDKQFIYNSISFAGGGVSWLSVNPAQGTVLSGSSMDISVTFDATGLDEGDYNANIVISSNDPDENPFDIPVTLSVSDGGPPPPNSVNLSWCENPIGNVAGAQDTVYVCVNDVTGQDIFSYQIVVSFDESVLNAVGGVSIGTISESFGPPTVNTATAGEITIGGFGTAPLSGSGALVGLIFDVVGNPGDVTNLCFQSAIFNSGDPAATIPDPCCLFEVFDDKQVSIAGNVNYNITKGPVENVSMTLTGGASITLTTDTNGDYLFGNLPSGLNYTVTPSKTGDFDTNSITCFDAALAAQHAVGLITLTPEQQKAADIDEDGFIFTFDAAQICRFAVGMPPLNENDQTGQWRFDPRNISYTPLNSDQTGQDYGATLLGDIDGNWSATASAKQMIADGNYKQPADITTGSGEVVSLPLMVEETANVYSIDIDLEYDPKVLQFVEVSRTELSEEFKLVTNDEVGRLRLGAYGTEAVMQGGALLLLRFKVVGKEGAYSNLTWSRYQLNGSSVDRTETELFVTASTAAIPKQFSLSQNYPNPFNPETTIRFEVPNLRGEDVRVRLSIYNATGQLVRKLVSEQRDPGTYEVKWDGRNEIGEPVSSGVYFYTMTAGEFNATKKMLYLK